MDGEDPILQQDFDYIVGTCAREMSQLAGKSLLVTGGSGFVGRYVVESVIRFNEISGSSRCNLTLITRQPGLLQQRYQAQIEAGDIMVRQWGEAHAVDLGEGRWDYVVHAASPSDPELVMRDPYGSLRAIVNMSASISQVARESQVRRAVLLSSGAVYGEQPADMAEIPEEYCGGPDISQATSSYGEGKRLSEMLFRVAGIDQRTARVFSLTGPYQDQKASFAVPDLVQQAVDKGFLQLTGDGSAVRSYCYAADLAVFLFKVLLGDPARDVYNVGCREGTATIGEVADAVAAIFGGLEVRKAPQADGVSAHRSRYVPRLDRMDEVYSPRTGFREGLLRTCHSLYNRGLIDRRPVGPAPVWSRS